MMHIAMFLAFLCASATLITYLLFIITQNPWLCCFILAGSTVMIVLENVELQQEVKRKEEDNEVLKTTCNEDIVKQMNRMSHEIKVLELQREEQKRVINILKLKLILLI